MPMNVKLMNHARQSGGTWKVDPSHHTMIDYINRELTVFQQEEPHSDWHLESCGSLADWHRVIGALPNGIPKG